MTGRRRLDPGAVLGPERIALTLSILVVVTALVVGASRPASDAVGSDPSASPPATPIASPTPPVEPALISVLEVTHERLAATGEALQQELLAAAISAPDIATLLRSVTQTARFGLDTADRLNAYPIAADVAADLGAFYETLLETTGRGLAASLANTEAYRVAAAETVSLLERLPSFNLRLAVLRRPGPVPTIPPTAPPSPSGSPVGPSAGPTTPPEGTPSPSVEPSRPPGELLRNGGFEEGVGTAWQLRITSGAARLETDPTAFGGRFAARVAFTSGTDVRSGIALRQDGVQLSAGTRYVASVALRAAEPREVRVQIATDDGRVYGTRLFSIGTDWQVYAFDFVPFESATALFELGLGRSVAAVSVDDASLRAGAALSP